MRNLEKVRAKNPEKGTGKGKGDELTGAQIAEVLQEASEASAGSSDPMTQVLRRVFAEPFASGAAQDAAL